MKNLTIDQQAVLDLFKANKALSSQFYFTGGTALSACYLHHRDSEDIDFFSQEKLDPLIIDATLRTWEKELGCKISYRDNEVVTMFFLEFAKKKPLKVDFGYYPYRELEKKKIVDGIRVDSLIDIGTNKLLTVLQRTEVKDFVDLYFLLKKFTIWDLLEGVRIKFRRDIELVFLATDFLKVEDFTYLPPMHKPLTLVELQEFFKQKALQLSKKVVE